MRQLLQCDQYYRIPENRITLYIELSRLRNTRREMLDAWARGTESRQAYLAVLERERAAWNALTDEQVPLAENNGGIFGFASRAAYVNHLEAVRQAVTGGCVPSDRAAF